MAIADEMTPGTVLARTFCGSEIAVFRTESGRLAAVDAYCPHMGAHLGKGGLVDGEEIRCPFHDFRFDCSGQCTASGYGTKAPPKARVKPWEVREKNGLIMVWFGAGEPPSFEVPDLPMDGWTYLKHTTHTVKTHPQETTENSVDIGHFGMVHGYSEIEQLAPLHTDGPYLRSKYAFTRNGEDIPWAPKRIRVEFTAEIWGLGYSVVHAYAEPVGLTTRLFVLPTPTDGDRVEIRAATAVSTDIVPRKLHPLLALVPKRFVIPIVHKMAFQGYQVDLAKDFEIWENKIYAHPPLLAKGDGPIPQYRKWARQFYREDRLHEVRELPA